MRGQPAGGNRHGYWFPLALLGFLLLGWLAVDSVRSSRDFGWFAYQQSGGIRAVGVEGYSVLASYSDYPVMSFALWQHPSSRDWPWAAIVIATFVATVAWYGWRARRAGAMPSPSELVTSVGLPLALLGAIAGAWAYFRLGPGRRLAAAISVACLLIGASVLLGSQVPLLVDPVIITGGLLGLAWFERSAAGAATSGEVTAPAG